jgi:tRNA (guanosine-2'-O-)-methyltransferase
VSRARAHAAPADAGGGEPGPPGDAALAAAPGSPDAGRPPLGEAGFLVPERKARIDQVVAQRTRTLTVVMEAVCDPQNVNAVLRTCEGFGVQTVHVVEGPMKVFDRNKKVSQNADKWLEVRRWESTRACLEALRAEGFAVYAAHLGSGSRTLGELPFAGKVALVFGNEHSGVSDETLALADASYAIPMRGFVQSLNVSVAAGISLATAVERRLAERGRHGDLDEAEAAALRDRFYVLAVKQRARISKAQAVAERAERRIARGRGDGSGSSG